MAITKAGLKKQLHAMGIKTYRNKEGASLVKKGDIKKIFAAQNNKYYISAGIEVLIGPNSLVHETDIETFNSLKELASWILEVTQQFKGEHVKVNFKEEKLYVSINFKHGNAWFEINPEVPFDDEERDILNKQLKTLG